MGGCTILGYSVAQTLADQNKVSNPIDGPELRDLPRDTKLRVDLFRGGFYAGKLEGLEAEPDSAYARRYNGFRNGYGSWLPAIGESVVVRTRSDVPGEFRAFDLDGIQLEDREEGIGLRNIFSVDAEDETPRGVSGDELLNLISGGRIPYQTALLMEVRGERARVFADEISAVYKQEPARWVWFPIGIGILFDAALIYYVSNDAWGN